VKGARKIVMFATLGVVAVLVLLSIVGAFLGVDGARAFFNSPAMVVFWIALTGLLLVGFVFYKKLLRSPGALAAHLGPLLVLIGAMQGSARGHAVMARLFGVERTPSGFMRIDEGRRSRSITDEEGREIATLPFEIGLEDFWMEYYDAPGPWRLGVDAPASTAGRSRRMREIDWHVGEEVAIPFIGARVKVLQYLPSARPAFDEGAVPTLEVIEADGRRSVVPATVGQQFDLDDPAGTLKIVRVFSHLLVRDGEVIDLPGSAANPAVKVVLEAPNGDTTNRYAFANTKMPGHGERQDGLQLNYALPTESGAVVDPDTGLPAMEVLVRGEDNDEMRGWLIAHESQRPVVLSLAPILDLSAHAGGAHHNPDNAFLMLVGRTGAVRDYKSRLTVLDDDGQQQLEQVIEVNSPLHYGGYHFYQHSYDNRQGRFTVLAVRSDAGLSMVYAGFIILCLGVMWLFWGRPALAYLKGGAEDGN